MINNQLPLKSGVVKSIGTNGFHWYPDNLVKIFGEIRLYLHLQFLWRPNGLYVEPLYQGGSTGTLGLDGYFERLKAIGTKPRPCLNSSPSWIVEQHGGDVDCKPILKNADPLKPESYKDIAELFFNFAARYGKVAVSHDRLKVDTELRWGMQNEIKSGLDLCDSVECLNEQWSWWVNRFTPEEYAVCYSMCYDGHEGLFPNCGVKNADPDFQLWMGGMSEMNTHHMDRFLKHLKEIRVDGDIIEVVNFHHYSNLGNTEDYLPKQWIKGVSPEQDQIEMRLQRMIDWRNHNQPNAKLAFSEFGFDTNPNGQSWQKANLKDQSNWLARTYLLSLSKEIDHLMMFNLIDEPNWESGSLFASCGLASSEHTGAIPKQSYNLIKSIITELNKYEFVKDISIGKFRVLVFSNNSSLKYYYWHTEKSGSARINGMKLQFEERPKVFRIIKAIGHTRNKGNSGSKEPIIKKSW